MTESPADHWDSVYRTKQAGQMSWTAAHLTVSLALLNQAGLNTASRVIDLGAGASTLVDDLLDVPVAAITVVDISSAAIKLTRQRLASRSAQVQFVTADVADLNLTVNAYDFWHDRAALHFLVEESRARAYVASAGDAVVSGGFVVIGCFAKDGPERCSGLPVVRRDSEDVADLFGSTFELVDCRRESHTTPWGSPQSFAFSLLRKKDRAP
jgi:SAM-dependent methyltransferase